MIFFIISFTLEYRIVVLSRLLIFQIFSNPPSLFQPRLLSNLENLKSSLRESVHCSAHRSRNRIKKYKEQLYIYSFVYLTYLLQQSVFSIFYPRHFPTPFYSITPFSSFPKIFHPPNYPPPITRYSIVRILVVIINIKLCFGSQFFMYNLPHYTASISSFSCYPPF